MRRTFLAKPMVPMIVLLALLAACGTRPAMSPTPAPPSAPASPAPRATLALEQVRLTELFRGTPVVFAMQQDGNLRATVPRRFSFDAGESKIKLPLAAVLDRLAKSQLNTGARIRVSAPTDPDVRGPTLARDRASSVRDYLAGQGIAATRLQASGAALVEIVEIVVSDATR